MTNVLRRLRHDGGMPDLTGETILAAIKLAVQEQPSADSHPGKDKNKILALASCAEEMFSDRGRIGIVLNEDLELCVF